MAECDWTLEDETTGLTRPIVSPPPEEPIGSPPPEEPIGSPPKSPPVAPVILDMCRLVYKADDEVITVYSIEDSIQMLIRDILIPKGYKILNLSRISSEMRERTEHSIQKTADSISSHPTGSAMPLRWCEEYMATRENKMERINFLIKMMGQEIYLWLKKVCSMQIAFKKCINDKCQYKHDGKKITMIRIMWPSKEACWFCFMAICKCKKCVGDNPEAAYAIIQMLINY